MTDSTRRFSDRVDAYVKNRPSYPVEIIDLLKAECSLTRNAWIADIGSGTGLLAKLFLDYGNPVIGVEPDQKMRAAGERMLAEYPLFKSIAGTAETTHLEDGSIDFVTAGQAFHWFDTARARREFKRILKPEGWVVLIWNVMQTSSTAFLKAYHSLLLNFGTDYETVVKSHGDAEVIHSFFTPATVNVQTFENSQRLDFEGLKGRLQSSSFTPQTGEPGYREMMQELKIIFDTHQKQSSVMFTYDTKVFYGQPGKTT